jgi:hypothetical protein
MAIHKLAVRAHRRDGLTIPVIPTRRCRQMPESNICRRFCAVVWYESTDVSAAAMLAAPAEQAYRLAHQGIHSGRPMGCAANLYIATTWTA